MRLWSLHPRYLDPQGLVAVWREGLLARAVLRGATRGYTRHPQLERFRGHPAPSLAIDAYLAAIHAEALARGYSFDRSKIDPVAGVAPIAVTQGQLSCEREHLLHKLALRNPHLAGPLQAAPEPLCHPLFRPCPGPVEPWERARPAPERGRGT